MVGVHCHSSWPWCNPTLIARFMGQHGAQLGPTGPRWAPCWPHEPCYLGINHSWAHFKKSVSAHNWDRVKIQFVVIYIWIVQYSHNFAYAVMTWAKLWQNWIIISHSRVTHGDFDYNLNNMTFNTNELCFKGLNGYRMCFYLCVRNIFWLLFNRHAGLCFGNLMPSYSLPNRLFSFNQQAQLHTNWPVSDLRNEIHRNILIHIITSFQPILAYQFIKYLTSGDVLQAMVKSLNPAFFSLNLTNAQ